MKIKPMLGEFALENIEYLESSESRALVEHRVPGLTGSYFQDMGTVPTTITITGSKSGDEGRDSFLEGIRAIFNAGEPTIFVADINTATDLTEVVIEDLQVAEIGGSIDSFRYLIKLRKYIEPPEPPATGLLDMGILDDALSLVDALNAIDALSSIANLGDPTPPVRQALDGVKSATVELPGAVEQVQNLSQAFPSQQPITDILAPILGDEAAGTGVAKVLNLLEQVDTGKLSVSVTADLDKSFTASVSVDASALTGGTLEQFQKALEALPSDPALLTAPLTSKLSDIKQLSSTELSAQLGGGIDGLRNIQTLIPKDAQELIAGAAERLSQLKGEFLGGEFGQLRQWSQSVQALYDEIAPLLAAGPGTLEERLLAYLREKITALVKVLLPEGDLAAALSGQLDGAVSADLAAQLNTLKTTLIDHLNRARLDFDTGNFTNTINLGNATATFQQLVDLLAGLTAKLRPIFEGGLGLPAGLAGGLQKQFEVLEQIEIIDLGNIKDKFVAAIKKVEKIIADLDLGGVQAKIDGVFAKLDAAVGKFDPGQFTSKLTALREQLEAILDGIDGALFAAVASMRTAFGQIKEALRTVAAGLGTYGEDGRFRFHVQEDLERFLNGIKATLHDTIEPLLNQLKVTVGQTLQQVQTSLQAVQGEIDRVKAQLESSLQGIHAQLQSLDVTGTMTSIGQKLEGMLGALGTVDFDVVVNPVVAEIDEMRDAMKKIDLSSLNEFSIGALKVSVEVVVQLDFSAQITGVLMAEIDQLLEIPKKALADLEGRVEGALQQFGALAPATLLAPLDKVFQPITAQLNALKLEVLVTPLDEWYAKMQGELDRVSPAALLQPLIAFHGQLQQAFQAIFPAALMRPLAEAMDGIKNEIRQLDVTGVAADLGATIDHIKKALAEISPARLFNPLVGAFDKIMGALDSFDPGILLQPFAAMFAALTTPLANLTADQAGLIGEIFGVLRSIVDAFNPERLFQVRRDKLSAVQSILQQVNPGGLIASLKTPYDALQGSFQVHGGPAHVSVAASVEGLNPLRNAALGQVVTDFQSLQAKLNAAMQAQPPAALVQRYQKVKSNLELLVPTWAKGNITAASVRRAFEVANPLSLKTEIDQLYGAVKQKVRTFDPRVIQERLQGSFDKFQGALLAFDPNQITAGVQDTVKALTQRLEAVNVQLIADELQGLADEIKEVISGLDPQPIIGQLQGLVEEVTGAVAALQPSQVLAELQAPFEASKALVAEFDPSVFTEPLQSVFEDIQAILEAIDLGVILQPLADRLKQLRDALEKGLQRTEVSFNGMLKAIPV